VFSPDGRIGAPLGGYTVPNEHTKLRELLFKMKQREQGESGKYQTKEL